MRAASSLRGFPGMAANRSATGRSSARLQYEPLETFAQDRRSCGYATSASGSSRAPSADAVVVTLCEITEENREAVLALRVAPGQERFVGAVRGALREAAEYRHAKPWYLAVYGGDEPVGFV